MAPSTSASLSKNVSNVFLGAVSPDPQRALAVLGLPVAGGSLHPAPPNTCLGLPLRSRASTLKRLQVCLEAIAGLQYPAEKFEVIGCR